MMVTHLKDYGMPALGLQKWVTRFPASSLANAQKRKQARMILVWPQKRSRSFLNRKSRFNSGRGYHVECGLCTRLTYGTQSRTTRDDHPLGTRGDAVASRQGP